VWRKVECMKAMMEEGGSFYVSRILYAAHLRINANQYPLSLRSQVNPNTKRAFGGRPFPPLVPGQSHRSPQLSRTCLQNTAVTL
jgi:hypothetical protein